MKKNRLRAILLALVLCLSFTAAGCSRGSSDKEKSKTEKEQDEKTSQKDLPEGDLGTGEEVLILDEGSSESVSSDMDELEKEEIVEGSVMEDDVQFVSDEEYEKQNSGKGR